MGMLKEQTYTEERCTIIQEFQKAGNDADEKHVGKYPWYESYLRNGRKALENYLGTEKEINFEEVNRLVHAFKAGGEKVKTVGTGTDTGCHTLRIRKAMMNTKIRILSHRTI